jgi:hypothetical protein
MLPGNERIERKARLLERLDPKRGVGLKGAFVNRLADAIRASGPAERRPAVDEATKAYEDALDGALYEILDERFAAENSTVS